MVTSTHSSFSSLPANHAYYPSAPVVMPSTQGVNSFVTDASFNVQYLNPQEAQPVILADDDFMDELSDLDCQLRLRSKETTDLKSKYKRHYANQVLNWTADEIAHMNAVFARIRPKLAQYKITLPKTINIVKTTGREELDGTGAYCRKNTIVFCNTLSGEDLLTHELFHIHSQVDSLNRGKLYELIGFHPCKPLKLPNDFAAKKVVNPDSPLLNAFIEVIYKGKKVKAVPFDCYEEKRDVFGEPSGGSTFLPHVFHKFIAIEESQEEVTWAKDEQGNPIVFDFNACENFDEQIGRNTNYTDSPEEIMAINFVTTVLNKQAQTPALIEKVKNVFKKTTDQIPTVLPQSSHLNAEQKKPSIKISKSRDLPIFKKIFKAIFSPFLFLKRFFQRCFN